MYKWWRCPTTCSYLVTSILFLISVFLPLSLDERCNLQAQRTKNNDLISVHNFVVSAFMMPILFAALYLV